MMYYTKNGAICQAENEENLKMGKEYFLGLSMGTNAVGWAVTDSQYHLLRAKGKDLWGIREFDEAELSADRRMYRAARRRRQRETARNGLLRDYFADAIQKVDPNFYERLDNSKYFLEDKDEAVRTPNSIFNDKDYKDKDYYRDYPTIYHLRRELLNNPAPHDVRLVYLAVSNMFKYRGNFLFASLDVDHVGADISKVYADFVTGLSNTTDITIPAKADAEKLVSIIGSRDTTKSKKAEDLLLLWADKKNKPAAAAAKLICGLKADLRVVFKDLAGADEKIEVCFNDADFDDRMGELADAIGDADMEVIYAAKSIYDLGLLSGIGVIGANGNSRYFSEIRCEEYTKHHEDLNKLKRVMRRHFALAEYDAMFRSGGKGSYSAYVNSYNSDTAENRREKRDTKLRRNMSDRKQDDLYKTIKGYLKNVQGDPEGNEILADIDKGTFLPKQLTSENRVIPNQIHARELKTILTNASSYLPFLNDKDESGLTTAERIMKLFTFRIPYYVGPVTEKSRENGGNGWVVRKESGRVLPWNLDEKVDLQKTSAEFIQRMVRQCTYISGEKVLPKASLIYERFAVLNELNSLQVDGKRISIELKQGIYRDVYEQGKKVTNARLVKYLIGKGIIKDAEQLSGMNKDANNALLSFGKFRAVFGERIREKKYQDLAEQIIFWCTVYGDSKQLLKQVLRDKYSAVLSEDQIRLIQGMRFRDWGRMSKAFLELPGVDYSTGEKLSLLDAMWNYNLNLMELLNTDLFSFKEAVSAFQTSSLSSLRETKPEDLDEFYFTAPVKRMVWQAICVVKELEKAIGNTPARVFIDIAQPENERPERKVNRAAMFRELYKKMIKKDPKWGTIIDNAEKDGTIRSKKMYLYLTQMGRDMYTGQPIDLDKLFDNNLYDIDHIYPRQYVKDDSLRNNLILVERPLNRDKSNSYPVAEKIRQAQAKMWHTLLVNKLISQEKYTRLIRDKAFSDSEMASFIAQQSMKTGQKAYWGANILQHLLPDTRVICTRPENVSEFRHNFDIPRSELVNNNFHANDAYLDVVVGNVYDTKFTQNPMNFIKEYRKDPKKNHYNLGRMYDWDVVRNGVYAWKAENGTEDGTIATVREVLRKQSPISTKLTFEVQGALSNATVYGRRTAKPGAYLPVKGSDERLKDVTKYGGTTNITTAYFFLVEHTKKGRRTRSIECLPVYMREAVRKTSEKLEEYCVQTLGFIDPVIRVREIKKYALLKVNGYFMRISGRSGSSLMMHNATPLCVSPFWTGYIRKIEKYHNFGIRDMLITSEKNIELFQMLEQKYTGSIFTARPNNPGKMMAANEDRFNKLDAEDQAESLYQLLMLSKIGKATGDLTKIGGSATAGTMSCNKDISKMQECTLIDQSATGLYERKVDLLTV